jgi:hypothetical protein
VIGRCHSFEETKAEDHYGLGCKASGSQELLDARLDDLRLHGPDGCPRFTGDAILVDGFD